MYWGDIDSPRKKILMLGQEEKGATEGEMVGWHH